MTPATITCPCCDGDGDEVDMFGEVDACRLCEGAGVVDVTRAGQWRDEEAQTAQALAAWTRGDTR